MRAEFISSFPTDGMKQFDDVCIGGGGGGANGLQLILVLHKFLICNIEIFLC